MGTFLQHMLGESPWTPLLLILIDAGLKGLVLLVAATLTTLAMQRSSAAARHLVWMLALVALLALPLVTWVAPQWQLAILPAPATTEVVTPPAAPKVSTQTPRAHAPDNSAVQEPSVPRSTTQAAPPAEAVPPPVAVPAVAATPPTPSTSLDAATGLLLGWLALALLVLAPLVMGHVAVLRLQRRTDPFEDGPLTRLTNEIAKVLSIRQPVRLHRATSECMPMAAGMLKAAVFLPASAETWPETRQRVVLLHELAHVKRRDCLTHALARFVVALHWFNPLAWYALRQLRIEREHACDDLVLAAGERPADYAENLLEIARNFRAGRLTSAAAITMAKKSHLEGRLLAVLDAARKRTRMTRRTALGFALPGALLTAALATLHITRADSAVVVDHLTFSSGVEVTLLGVGIPSRDDDTPPWKPDGTPMDGLPEGLSEFHVPDLTYKGRVIRQIYQQIKTPDNLADADTVAVRAGGYSKRYVPASTSTVGSGTLRVDEKASRFDIDVGVAAGPWEALAQTLPENGAQGTRQGVTYNILVGKPFQRDDEYRITLTHDVVDLDTRVVVYDTAGKMHYTPAKGMAPGINGNNLGEYSLDGIEPDKVRLVELQVREFEWRTLRNIAVNPGASNPPSDEVEEAEAIGNNFAAAYANGVRARVVAIGDDGPREYGNAWEPDGTLLTEKPEEFKDEFALSSSAEGVYRRLLIEVAPDRKYSDVSLSWRLNGNKGGSSTTTDETDKKYLYIETKISAETDSGVFELGIAAGPWESIHGTAGPHSAMEGNVDGNAFGAAYSDFFEKDGKAHVVVTHTPREDDFRLVVFDSNDTPHTTRKGTSNGVGTMWQTEFVVKGDISADELEYMDLQARPFEWKSIPGIATRPDASKREHTRHTTDAPPHTQLEVRLVAQEGQHEGASQVPWQEDSRPLPDTPDLWLLPEAFIDQNGIASVVVRPGPSEIQYALAITLNEDAAERLAQVTAENVGQQLAIIVNGQVVSAPHISSRISGGKLQITGRFDQAAAEALAAAIRGASPAIAALRSGSALGPVVEATVHHSGKDCLIDFDTGELHTPPDFNGTEEALAWMAVHGIDAGGGIQEEIRGLIGMDLIANPESNGTWDTVETNGALDHDALTLGTPGNPVYLSAKGELPATYTFKTREGGVGIVQILGFIDEAPRSVNIRYRMRLAEAESTGVVEYDYLNSLEESELLATPRVSTRSKKEIPIASWVAPNPNPEAVLAMLREEGIEDVTRYHDMAEAWALEEVGLSCRPDSSGKLRLKGMPYAPRLLAFPDGAAPRDAMQQLREAPERLIESEEWTATLPFDALRLFAALNDKGETWFLLFDTDDTHCRNVYLWRSREDQAIHEARAWVDELMIPQDQLAWGEVNNGLQAAVLLKSPKVAYPLNEAIPMAFVLRNASDTRIELVTIEWRDDYTVLATTPNNEKRESNASQGTGLRRVQRIKLAPGQVVEIRAASCAFVSEDYDWMSDGKITAALTTQPGIHKVRFVINFPKDSMRSGKGAPQPGDWEGTLTTGELSIVVVTPQKEIDALVWGETVDGLQAALKLSPSARPLTLNERVQADIWIRNVHQEDIEFTALNTALPGEIIVRDAAGNRVATGSNQVLDISSGLHRYVIKPGEMATIGHPDITFIAEPDAENLTWNRIALEPGEYTVQVTSNIVPFAELGFVGLDGETLEALPGDWTGTLTTGMVRVDIGERPAPEGR